jgi:hypothetical protein
MRRGVFGRKQTLVRWDGLDRAIRRRIKQVSSRIGTCARLVLCS